MVLHIVEPGQTLYSIARQYGVSPERLRTNNGIGPTAQLAVGQCIAVLFPLVTHVVRAGETLYSIADAYGTTVLQLLRNNLFLNGRDLLLPGMVLVIRYERDPLGTYPVPYTHLAAARKQQGKKSGELFRAASARCKCRFNGSQSMLRQRPACLLYTSRCV